jgi:hypothetical protein
MLPGNMVPTEALLVGCQSTAGFHGSDNADRTDARMSEGCRVRVYTVFQGTGPACAYRAGAGSTPALLGPGDAVLHCRRDLSKKIPGR